jgi:hypothetical protein
MQMEFEQKQQKRATKQQVALTGEDSTNSVAKKAAATAAVQSQLFSWGLDAVSKAPAICGAEAGVAGGESAGVAAAIGGAAVGAAGAGSTATGGAAGVGAGAAKEQTPGAAGAAEQAGPSETEDERKERMRVADRIADLMGESRTRVTLGSSAQRKTLQQELGRLKKRTHQLRSERKR